MKETGVCVVRTFVIICPSEDQRNTQRMYLDFIKERAAFSMYFLGNDILPLVWEKKKSDEFRFLLKQKAHNLTRQMQRFPILLHFFHMSTWKGAHKKRLEKGGHLKKNNWKDSGQTFCLSHSNLFTAKWAGL